MNTIRYFTEDTDFLWCDKANIYIETRIVVVSFKGNEVKLTSTVNLAGVILDVEVFKEKDKFYLLTYENDAGPLQNFRRIILHLEVFKATQEIPVAKRIGQLHLDEAKLHGMVNRALGYNEPSWYKPSPSTVTLTYLSQNLQGMTLVKRLQPYIDPTYNGQGGVGSYKNPNMRE